jgi:hypothetical protein
MITRTAAALAACLLLAALDAPAAADQTVDDFLAQGKFCSATAQAAARACGNQTQDDYWIAVGVCINEPEARDRADCLDEAKAARDEATQLCADQKKARFALCAQVGEDRYDPEFEPASFDSNFAHPTNPNPYFPLTIGAQWEFRSATQTDRVTVTNATKLIDEVRCIVVRDEVFEKGVIVEATNDWYAQAKNGTVWYCGEETASFETFAGDRPRTPELVSIDGSFKAGRDGDKPGIIFQAAPAPGQVYIEESSLGNAEDGAQILAVDYTYGKRPELDERVPAKLAKLLCAGNCVVTKNFSQIEPDVIERKYYAPGIGVFLEVEPGSGEVVRLVKCNVDPRCASLPH